MSSKNNAQIKLGMSWVSETLGTLAVDKTGLERWRWEIDADGWSLVFEGKRFWARELLSTSILSNISHDKNLQIALVSRLKMIVDIFSESNN